MPIAALPIAPSITRPVTFAEETDTFLLALDPFRTDANQLLADAQTAASTAVTKAGEALGSAGAASTSATNAATSEANAASSAGAAKWVSGTTYALGAAVWSPANRVVYRRIVAGAGTTDPSADATNWAMLGTIGLTVVTVSTTTTTAAANGHYVLTNVAATTLTLPASPGAGDTVAVTVANGLVTNIIARNGQTIMGLAENMTLDNALTTVTLRFLNSTWRLV